jgi:hypothetical protein
MVGRDISFDDRPIIDFSRKQHIVKDTENNHRNQQHTGVIHIRGRNWGIWRPKAEEQYENEVRARKDVDEYPKPASEVPGSPDQTIASGVGEHTGRVGSRCDATRASTVEDKGYGKEVAEIKAGNCERDDDVETERRANDYQRYNN